MSQPRSSESRNALLSRLAEPDRHALQDAAELMDLDPGHCFYHADEPMQSVYFPESGLASVTSHDNPTKVEIGLIGREGFVGLPILLGTDRAPTATYVQMAGRFLHLPLRRFQEILEVSPGLHDLLLRFAQTYIMQVSSTAVANASFNVEQRLARWLLMVHDRADGNDLVLTHDFVAVMLGVRRPGVTVATHVLEGERAIRATRGRIEIVDRARLKAFAGESYGLAEREYERIIGAPLGRT